MRIINKYGNDEVENLLLDILKEQGKKANGKLNDWRNDKDSKGWEGWRFKTRGRMKRKETRLTIVDVDTGKRLLEKWNVEIEESVQDNGKTLKLFLRGKKWINH